MAGDACDQFTFGLIGCRGIELRLPNRIEWLIAEWADRQLKERTLLAAVAGIEHRHFHRQNGTSSTVLVRNCILRIRFHALGWSCPISKEANDIVTEERLELNK